MWWLKNYYTISVTGVAAEFLQNFQIWGGTWKGPQEGLQSAHTNML
jgi:hypothetical protein